MKRCFLFLIVLFSLTSCTEDVRFNNPSFQGTKDGVFWRAVQATATINALGSLVIEAYTATEIVTLKTNSTSVATYFLGTTTDKIATYVNTDPLTKESIIFSTGFDVGDGQIVITEYDVAGKTISGTFKFNLENTFDNPLVGPVLNFQNGVFYKIPVVFK